MMGGTAVMASAEGQQAASADAALVTGWCLLALQPH
jgi:hypothetical protein